jgi:PAS domain S-box-containing protein
MICLHEPDGTYTFVSPSVKKILGYDPEELIGTNPYELFHPEDQELIKSESHLKALEKDPTKSFHYRIQKKDGSYIWFDTATETITDENDEVVKLQTTSRDITDRKKLEIIFAQAQKMASVGGWEYDLESGDLTWTEEVYRIHEIPIGTPVKVEDGISFYPDKAKEVIQEKISLAIEEGIPWDEELPFITAKGNQIWVRSIGKALRKNGKAYKLRGTFQDTTKKKEYEEQIAQQNKELTNLTEVQNKLYSIISHDLKGAFFGINGMLELLMVEVEDYPALDDEFVRKLEMVEQSANQAHQLFENLLDWTRMQKGNMEPNLKEIDIASKINRVVVLLNSIAEKKKITIETDFKSTPIIKGDDSMIETILRNLISNALKFSEAGKKIDLSVSETDTNCLISIKDYGIGMPAEVKKSLFDPSNRPKRKGTNQEKGTGLGMLLCKEMIDLHNGSIEVNSEVGKGTEFVVSLPKI